jgi:hypothetical protein
MDHAADEWDNPYQAPEILLEPERGWVLPKTVFVWVRLVLGLQLVTTIIGLGFSVWHVESIVGTGPILALLGSLVAIVSFRHGLTMAGCVGLSAVPFTATVFLIIFLQNWSPGDARRPVPVMGAAYLILMIAGYFAALHQMRQRERTFVDLQQKKLDPAPGNHDRGRVDV